MLYSASDIAVYDQSELVQHPFLSKIGPDILNSELRWEVVAERLQHSRFCNRGLSALYLDQHFIAGIGNYLRTEILFAAGVHPDFKPKQLDSKKIESLARQTLIIGKRAYDTKGHTLKPTLSDKLKWGVRSWILCKIQDLTLMYTAGTPALETRSLLAIKPVSFYLQIGV